MSERRLPRQCGDYDYSETVPPPSKAVKKAWQDQDKAQGRSTYYHDEKGYLQRKTKDGRVRKNWKNQYRKASRRFLKDRCEECGVSKHERQLTIHHKIPLREKIVVNKQNCVTLCRECHDLAEENEAAKRRPTASTSRNEPL